MCVRNLSVWYPDQHYSTGTIHAYPYTIDQPLDYMPSIMNITLYNSYNGIRLNGGSGLLVANVYMTALKRGIVMGNGWETPYFYNVTIENSIWKNTPTSVITNAPTSSTDRANLDSYTTQNLTGIQIGQNDGLQVYNVSVKDAFKDILVQKLATDDHAFYGLFSKVTGYIEEVDVYPNIHFINTDKVTETSTMSYTFSSMRKPASTTNFYNVKNSPYNAKGDGVTDDTSSIQSALNAASSAGGGTVYMPQGVYKVSTHLSVPSGVELRGPYGAEHTSETIETCLLLAYEGKDTSTPDTDTAFITLNANSGVRGFSINYPEQGYGSTSWPVRAYPYTIRGNGSGIWVADVNLLNSYKGIDLATNRSDNHLISGVWGNVYKLGLFISNGSTGGVIERTFFSYGILYQTYKNNSPYLYGKQDLINYTSNNTVGFKFGNCTNETSYSAAIFNANIGLQFVYDRSGNCTNSTFWQPASDTSQVNGYLFESGDNIKFVGMVGGTSSGNWLKTTSAFTGTVHVYDKLNWGNTPSNKSINGGTVNFYNERSLTYNKPVTASSYVSGELPAYAVDTSETTKWAALYNGSTPNWLRVDLKQPSEIVRWVLKNAAVNGEPSSYNTSSFQIQKSDDDSTYTVVDGQSGYSYDFYQQNFTPTTTRYTRLVVYDGTQSGYDHHTRIYEFEVYGREGWHFTEGVIGWTSQYQVSNFAASDGKLNFTSTGTDPQILSPNNLNIDLSNFKKVKIKYKNGSSSGTAQLFFITNADQTYGESKSVTISTNGNDPVWTEYTFDFTNNGYWTGNLKQLRFDPVAGTGDISIDWIKLTN